MQREKLRSEKGITCLLHSIRRLRCRCIPRFGLEWRAMKAELTILTITAIIFMAFAALLVLSRLFTAQELLFIFAVGLTGAFISKLFNASLGKRKRRG